VGSTTQAVVPVARRNHAGHKTLRTPSRDAPRTHMTWFADGTNRGVFSVIHRGSSGSRARFGGTISNAPTTPPPLTPPTITGGLLLNGARIRAKGGVGNSTPLNVGVDVASALVFESFIRDSTRGTEPTVGGIHKGVVVIREKITFVMDQGSGAIGNGSFLTGI